MVMRKYFVFIFALLSFSLSAQDVNKSLQEAAAAYAAAPAPQAAEAPKPKYWTKTAAASFSFVQTSLTNWAAGGDNTVSLSANFDASANYRKNNYYGNNRIVLDYGFIYASSKPILQKNLDRLFIDCTWGRNVVKNLSFTANVNFQTQMTKGWNYCTPATKTDESGQPIEPTHADWKAARVMTSSFLSPATNNVALGLNFNPKPWISINCAPLTGSTTLCTERSLRPNYGMTLSKHHQELKATYGSTPIEDLPPSLSQADRKFLQDLKDGKEKDYLRPARFAFGTQLKIDVNFVIDKKVTVSSQLILFSNYLNHPENVRINWDNRITMPIFKKINLTFNSWLIYDDNVKIYSDKDKKTVQRVQFKEMLALAFSYRF